MPEPGSASPQAPPPPEALKSALKAFRKRLKLTLLDDESRLGRGAMTGGRRSEIRAIRPPDPGRFPQAVWDELAKQGKLKHAGHGLYQLLEP